MSTFRYFPGFPEGAVFDTRPCHFCGTVPALDGAWLDFEEDYDDPPPVCIEDLLADKARVARPNWVSHELANRVAARHSDWSAEQQERYVAERTSELAHTPPVPWLQENEWPVCSDDYAKYAGEITRDTLLAQYGGAGAAHATLQKIMSQERPKWLLDAEQLEVWWQRLGDFLRVYRFHCDDGEDVFIVQAM